MKPGKAICKFISMSVMTSLIMVLFSCIKVTETPPNILLFLPMTGAGMPVFTMNWKGGIPLIRSLKPLILT